MHQRRNRRPATGHADRLYTRPATRPTPRPLMEAVEGRVLFSTFTVTTTADAGAGSLRQAILDANKTTAADTIKFAIGSGAKTIAPKSGLPAIAQPTLVDATTQPGFS